MRRILLMLVCALQSLFIYSVTTIPLSGRVGDRLTINAPSSTISNAPDLYSVQWSVINGDKNCVSLTNATSRTVTVNILKEGQVRIQCKCEFYNSSNPGYGKGAQSTFYDITCTNSGSSGGGGGNSGGGFGDGSLVVPNPTVGEGWRQYNNVAFYCAENTEEGIPMRFTRGSWSDPVCYTFSWQSGAAVCINPNTEGKVTIPAEVQECIVKYIGNYSFYNCDKLTEVVIPNTVTIINNGAFRGCSSLTTITIPESVVEIGLYAFRDCKSLKSITCLAENPPSVDDVFNGAEKDMTLYVLKGRKEIYEKWWTVWKDFKEIKEIEESFDITTSAAGYATFYSSFSAYELPEGLTASVVTEAANDKLTYSELGGNVIPKGTAVMLTSTSKNSGTYTLKRISINTTFSGTNLLMGSDEATTVASSGSDYYYKLSYGKSGSNMNNVFGWYWGAANGGAFQIEANKAWLVVPKSAVNTRGFAIDGNTTGINALPINGENAVFYDLQGRRIDKPTKGVYISSGKKVIIK